MTRNRLFSFLLVSSLLGIILPLTTYLSHPDNYFRRYYLGYAVFNASALFALLLFHTQVLALCTLACNWLHQPIYRSARIKIFACGLFIIFSYQTKAFVGFWFPSISGWTYEQIVTSRISLTDYLPENPKVPDFAKSAIIAENAKYVRPGYYLGKGMFLHFSDGKVLPANLGITDLVFPDIAFARYKTKKSRQDLFNLVRQNLASYRQNKRFLLPLEVAYPNHTVYMPITYVSAPPADFLTQISLWNLYVKVDEQKLATVIDAKLGWFANAN